MRPGESWCYVVRTVVSTEPVVESGPSGEACVEVRDVFAPAAPTGVAAFVRETGAEVSWSPSPEPDLARYRVYRAEEGGPSLRVAEVAAGTTAWLDTSPLAAPRAYTVTAVDANGNESPPSRRSEVRAP